LLLAHAHSVDVYRKKFKKTQRGVIGITLNSEWWEPASDSAADRQAALRGMNFTLDIYAQVRMDKKWK
jgi:beta-glucosidase